MKLVEITYRYDAHEGDARPRPTSPAEARDRLDAGNRSFAALLEHLTEGTGTAQRIISVDPRDLGIDGGDGAPPSQRPYAAVLGCSDARVPIELIFSEGPNDLFVVRVAGNGLGSEVLGSLKYAAEHLGASLKLVVVLGHSGCGAVSAAVDIFFNPVHYVALSTQHSLRTILDRLLIVVHATAGSIQAAMGADAKLLPGYRAGLIEASVILNAALTAHTVEKELATAGANDLQASYGVYLLSERIIWAPRAGSTEFAGLARAPRDAAAFGELTDAIVRSGRVQELLRGCST